MDRESFNRIAVDFNPAVADYAQARTPFRPRVEPLVLRQVLFDGCMRPVYPVGGIMDSKVYPSNKS
jgi:hypothetical protein